MERDDTTLDEVLARLPRYEAPASLRRALSDKYARRRSPWATVSVAACVVALAAAIVVGWIRPRADAQANLESELVNDHLRVLFAEHPLDIESTGIHDVKPWFSGKVDFAPPVGFAGDADFPLRGGAVAYVVDRKAAEFVFKRRLHTISLLVVPRAGLAWPEGHEALGSRLHARSSTTRGFHVVTWVDGDFGYALISDVDAKELFDLGARISG